MRVFRGRVYFPDCTTYINKKEILQTVDAPLIEELFSLATIFSVIGICAYDFLNLLIIHKISLLFKISFFLDSNNITSGALPLIN